MGFARRFLVSELKLRPPKMRAAVAAGVLGRCFVRAYPSSRYSNRSLHRGRLSGLGGMPPDRRCRVTPDIAINQSPRTITRRAKAPMAQIIPANAYNDCRVHHQTLSSSMSAGRGPAMNPQDTIALRLRAARVLSQLVTNPHRTHRYTNDANRESRENLLLGQVYLTPKKTIGRATKSPATRKNALRTLRTSFLKAGCDRAGIWNLAHLYVHNSRRESQ